MDNSVLSPILKFNYEKKINLSTLFDWKIGNQVMPVLMDIDLDYPDGITSGFCATENQSEWNCFIIPGEFAFTWSNHS
jgi:hypothetical protein